MIEGGFSSAIPREAPHCLDISHVFPANRMASSAKARIPGGVAWSGWKYNFPSCFLLVLISSGMGSSDVFEDHAFPIGWILSVSSSIRVPRKDCIDSSGIIRTHSIAFPRSGMLVSPKVGLVDKYHCKWLLRYAKIVRINIQKTTYWALSPDFSVVKTNSVW